MNAVFGKVNATLGAVVAAMGFAGYANAGCSSADVARAHAASLQAEWAGGLQSATFNPDSHDYAAMYVNLTGFSSIVGMWKFEFKAEGNGGPPDGATIDSGYVTWHSDGTELMNSGRAPTTGDFCMGVWQQVGPSTYKLNHFPLAWAFDADAPVTGPGTGGADFVGPANIREVVTLDRGGMSYHGHFELIQYDQDHNVLADILGSIRATRITVNTRITD